MGKVVGLDVSLDKTAVCVLDRDGTLTWQGKVGSEPEPLIDKLGLKAALDLVGLEACLLLGMASSPRWPQAAGSTSRP